MSIILRFSRMNGDRDQSRNKVLAKEILVKADQATINEIIEAIRNESAIDTLSDALKVIELIGEKAPELVKSAFPEILILLNHHSNKIQWRSMSALSKIAQFHQHAIFGHLNMILKIMDTGSVVTRDHGVKILIDLYENADFNETIAALLEEQLMLAPDNQLGQYAEKWLEVIQQKHLPQLAHSLQSRQTDLTNASHQKRISRVLRKLSKTQQP